MPTPVQIAPYGKIRYDVHSEARQIDLPEDLKG